MRESLSQNSETKRGLGGSAKAWVHSPVVQKERERDKEEGKGRQGKVKKNQRTLNIHSHTKQTTSG